jgi:hypothetical protein
MIKPCSRSAALSESRRVRPDRLFAAARPAARRPGRRRILNAALKSYRSRRANGFAEGATSSRSRRGALIYLSSPLTCTLALRRGERTQSAEAISCTSDSPSAGAG